MAWLQNLEAHLVADWRECYKWASMQLAGVAGLLAWLLAEYPTMLVSTAQMWMQLPSEIRTALGPVVGVLLLLIIAFARLWQQKRTAVG